MKNKITYLVSGELADDTCVHTFSTTDIWEAYREYLKLTLVNEIQYIIIKNSIDDDDVYLFADMRHGDEVMTSKTYTSNDFALLLYAHTLN